MANLSAIKLPNGTTYNLKDNGALQLTGGQVTGPVTFGDSVSIDDLTAGQLVVDGSASIANNLQVNTINTYAISSSATNNTIALRTANGYLFATYLNQSSGAETPTTSSYIMYANSDGYLRKSSLANIKTILGLGSAAYTASTAYLPSTHTYATSIATSSGTSQLTLAYNTKYSINAGGTSYIFTMPASDNTWRPIGTGASDAAAGNHTHTISLATDSGTSTVTLASAGKYKLTAGGQSVIFTMPTIPTVSYPVTSVNNKTGAVSLTYSDVGAAASSHTHNYAGSSSAGGSANSAVLVNGTYSGNGGAQPPSFVSGGQVRFAMMNNPKGLTGFPTYADTIIMDTYTGSDVPWTTGLGIIKQDANPRMFIFNGAKGNTTTWKNITEVLTSNNWSSFITIPTTLPASDVYSWAKASSKPSYTANEVGALASNTTYVSTVTTTAGTHTAISSKSGAVSFNVPTKTSHLTNDSSFVTSSGVTSIATTSPISGGTITGTGTISHATSGVGNAVSTAGFYKFKYDTYGHVTGVSAVAASDITALVTIPTNTDENVKSTVVTAATTNYIVGSTSSSTTTGGLSKHASAVMYTTADSGTSGYTQLRLGNTTATSSAGGKEGQIRLYGTTATYYVDLKAGAPSANRTITFPNATGTVALTSQIPSVPTSAASKVTGISISDHGTTSVGSASGWSAGTASTWAFTGVTVANSISGAVDGSDSTQLNITLGTTTVQSKSSGSNSTVPSLTITSTTVVNGKSHSITDNGHTHTLS